MSAHLLLRLGFLFIASYSIHCLDITKGDTLILISAASRSRRAVDDRSERLHLEDSLIHESSIAVNGIYLKQEVYRAEAGVGCDPQNNVTRFLNTYLKLAALDEHVYREGFSAKSVHRLTRLQLDTRIVAGDESLKKVKLH